LHCKGPFGLFALYDGTTPKKVRRSARDPTLMALLLSRLSIIAPLPRRTDFEFPLELRVF
jgi:hypothetical protein